MPVKLIMAVPHGSIVGPAKRDVLDLIVPQNDTDGLKMLTQRHGSSVGRGRNRKDL